MAVRAARTFVSLHQRAREDNDLAVILYNMSQCCPLWRFIWSPSRRRSQRLCRSVTFSRRSFLPLYLLGPLRRCPRLLLSKATLGEIQNFPVKAFSKTSFALSCALLHILYVKDGLAKPLRFFTPNQIVVGETFQCLAGDE